MVQLSTANTLHPRQVQDLKEEKAQKEAMLAAPDYVRRQLADGGAEVAKRLRAIDRVLETQAPQPIPANELDEAVRLEQSLRDSFTNGMPTQAEMRRNPAGAVDKHRAWEKRCKGIVLQWKNLRRRLHATGLSDHKLANESDVSNIELFRPAGGSGELNMHNEQIPGKQTHLPDRVTQAAVMSAEQEATLQALDPKLHSRMALLNNEQRAEVLKIVDEVIAGRDTATVSTPEPAEIAPRERARKKPAKRGSYNMSEMKALRDKAKDLGIPCWGKGKEQLRQEIGDKIAGGGA